VTDYGVFGNIVGTAGTLSAASAAIALSWMRRTKWQPPEEALPKVGSRVAGLVAMILIANLYVFAPSIGSVSLAIVSACLLLIAIIALSITIRTNITYSFYYPKDVESNRVLGGSALTVEAANIVRDHQFSEQKLFSQAQGDKDLVWTKDSQASVNLKSTLSFIALIAFGTAALAASAMLVAVYSANAR
jgi:hypothetical protein